MPRPALLVLAGTAVAAAGLASPLASPAHAAATRTASPLVDVAPPAGADFEDAVVEEPPRALKARAAQARSREYTTSDGHTVSVQLSDAYVADDAVAQTYVDFVAGLRHGDELGELTMRIVPAAEVAANCGAAGESGILACYLPTQDLMVVPGEEVQATEQVTTSYVIAHEYGHHVANHRSNAPFPALDFGPKRWASETDVCTHTLDGRLAPGDEAAAYAANPGEAWAETYAQLKYPTVGWSFTSLLRPTTLSVAAAKLDVSAPWTKSRTRTFRSRLTSLRTSRQHEIELSLDGALSFKLSGPQGADFDLVVSADGERQASTSTRGAQDRLAYGAACVRDPEDVTVTVQRRSGSGSYSLRVTYAG